MHMYPRQRATTSAVLSTPRNARIAAEHRRIRYNLGTIVAADCRLAALHPNPLVDQLLAAHGFDPQEAFSMRLIATRPTIVSNPIAQAVAFTAIIASSRAWHRGTDRELLHSVKQQALNERVRCILVPQRALAAPMRLATAKLISASRYVNFTATDRLVVLSHVQDEGWSTLSDCAALISHHPDPAGAILALVAKGDISIDRSRPIGPHSRIDCRF